MNSAEPNDAESVRDASSEVAGAIAVAAQAMARRIEALAEAAGAPGGPGAFEPVELELAGPGGRRAVLRFDASPRTPGRWYLELTVYTHSGQSTSSVWLDSGTDAELAAYLRKADTPAEMARLADEAVISLARNRLA